MAKTVTAPVAAPEATQNDHTEAVQNYLSLDATKRREARKQWDATISAAIVSGDLSAAQTAMGERDAALDAARSGGSSEPVDYSALVAERIAALIDAAEAIRTGAHVPAGVEPDQIDSERVESILAAMGQDDYTQTDDYAVRVAQIATERVSKRGQRHDVSAFVLGRLTALAAEGTTGPVRVSVLRAGVMTPPSSGAVSAALNAVLDGKQSPEGWTAVPATDPTADKNALSAVLV